MPLDPSIFLQGAALRQKNAEQFQNILKQSQDADLKGQEIAATAAKGLDFEKLAGQALFKQFTAQGLSSDDAAIKTWDTMNSLTNAIDPVTGNTYQKNRSVFDALGQGGQPGYTPQFPPLQGGDAGMVAPGKIGEADFGAAQIPMLAGLGQEGAAPAPAPSLGMAGRVAPPASTGNRKLDQAAAEKAQSLNMELEKDKIKEKTAPLNENQGKVATFADRMSDAENIFNQGQVQASQLSLKERGLDEIPVAGNFLVTENYQKARQAERNFINATLRRESGAAISPDEFKNARAQYIPQPGDGPDVLKQKAANRQSVISGFQREAGPAYNAQKSTPGAPVDYKAKYGLK